MIAVFAIVMAGLLIFAVGGGAGFFWQNYTLKVKFDNVAGLMTGSPVRVAGVQVGTVDQVVLSGDGVEVWFSVKYEYQPLVTDRSTAVLGTLTLLGEGAVDISSGLGGTPIPEWGYIRVGVAEGSIAQVTATAGSTLTEARLLVEDIRKGKGTVGQLFTNDSVYREFDALIAAAERVANSVASGKGTVGKMINDDKVYAELNAAVANLNAMTASVRNGEGSLGKLMTDPALANSLNATSANLETMTAKLNKGEGTAGKLLTDDALYKRLDSMTTRIDALVENLNKGQGTAGQLLHDQRLYENMNATAAELREFLAEVKKDPKKYLNVKVSIF